MPWKVVREGEKYKVVATNTGRVMGIHDARSKAEAQLRALYANVPDARGGSKKRG